MDQQLIDIVRGLNRRFPEGNNPYQMMTRLLEESGELAKEVNHFERTGIKVQKYGEPNRAKMAKEVQDVMRCAVAVMLYYGIEAEVSASIEDSYQRIRAEGLLDDPTPN